MKRNIKICVRCAELERFKWSDKEILYNCKISKQGILCCENDYEGKIVPIDCKFRMEHLVLDQTEKR